MDHLVVTAVPYASSRFLIAMLRLVLYYIADSKLAFTTGIEREGSVLFAHPRLEIRQIEKARTLASW